MPPDSSAAPSSSSSLSAGHSVTGFARTQMPCSCELLTGDVLDQAALERAVKGADAVCHLAALTQVRQSFEEPLRYFRVNVTGTLNLLGAMRAGVRRNLGTLRLVFASTGAVYGTPKTQPVTESQQPAPSNPYAASKLAAEAAIGYEALLGATSAVTLRTFNVAGAANGYGDSDGSRIIPRTLLVAAGRADCLNVNGDGSAIREYTHVADLAHACVLSLDSSVGSAGHRIYNVGGVGVSVRDVIETVERITDRPVPVRWGPPANEPRELRADSSRIRTELGWQASRSDLDTIVSDAWHALHADGR